MRSFLLSILAFVGLTILGCSAPLPKPVAVEAPIKQISYLDDVRPILDKRCVTCHSCYNSPCQFKLSSFEGVDRGANKDLVYNGLRIDAMDPTRLFTDANSTQQWRSKGFYSLTKTFEANETHSDSIMLQMLYAKRQRPDIVGVYVPEKDRLVCPKNREEMGTYLADKPDHGMPYGLPALKVSEYNTLAAWLHQGAKGPTKAQQEALTTPSKKSQIEITKWETFLNTKDPKHALTARYLYEHLFLAHWYFTNTPNEFYEIVRSTTPSPEPIEVIPTVRPFDDPKVATFYYRLRRIHSTIVHKTHMVVEFNDQKLARIDELFIQPQWNEIPHFMGYETQSSANPFISFFQIPAQSRYQFLLDNALAIVKSFIRGPVCRGQIALNGIHDHFWVMFQDPKYDMTLQEPSFLLLQTNNLSLPIETSTKNILDTFTDAYKERYRDYFSAKQKRYEALYPKGLGLEGIWAGNRSSDTPMLTIYRHFDSASVLKGVVGKLPRTMWVLDFPQFERLYYTLVAGYDVFGNISHQSNIRRYMDFLRMEGEMNFLTYMPKERRLDMISSWYIGDGSITEDAQAILHRETKVQYQTQEHTNEFVTRLVEKRIDPLCDVHFDPINHTRPGALPSPIPKLMQTKESILQATQSISQLSVALSRIITNFSANNMLVRVILPDEKEFVFSLIVNRWHDNVSSRFGEDTRLDPNKDDIDIVEGFVGSYPNAYAVVKYSDIADFFDLIQHYDAKEPSLSKFKKYFISRSDPDFWETFDWFQDYFTKTDPIEAGILDLNRYYPTAW